MPLVTLVAMVAVAALVMAAHAIAGEALLTAGAKLVPLVALVAVMALMTMVAFVAGMGRFLSVTRAALLTSGGARPKLSMMACPCLFVGGLARSLLSIGVILAPSQLGRRADKPGRKAHENQPHQPTSSHKHTSLRLGVPTGPPPARGF